MLGMVDTDSRLIPRKDRRISVEMTKPDGRRRIIPDFVDDAEANAWIIQTRRLIPKVQTHILLGRSEKTVRCYRSAVSRPNDLDQCDCDRQEDRPNLNSLLEFLGRPEHNLLARLDLDGLARRRVASHSGSTLPHLEDAETVQVDFVPFLEVAGRQRHQIAQHGLRLFLWQIMAVRQCGGQMLERDGRLRRGFRRCGGLLGSGGGS